VAVRCSFDGDERKAQLLGWLTRLAYSVGYSTGFCCVQPSTTLVLLSKAHKQFRTTDNAAFNIVWTLGPRKAQLRDLSQNRGRGARPPCSVTERSCPVYFHKLESVAASPNIFGTVSRSNPTPFSSDRFVPETRIHDT
jgi:hypothetical protein